MSAQSWRFARRKKHLVRWRGEDAPSFRAPTTLEVLTPAGWTKARLGLRQHLRTASGDAIDDAEAERLVIEACGTVALYEPARTGVRMAIAGSGPRWLLSPPLRHGARSTVSARRAQIAEAHFAQRLGASAGQRSLDEALAGLERGRDRHRSVESRSLTFAQIAGLASTLVLANSALLGKERPGGVAGVVMAATMLLASAAIVAAGMYGLFGAMRTFDRVPPNSIRRVVERARQRDDEAIRARTASTFLAQRRTAIVTDWKIERLKRATVALLIGVTLLMLSSSTLAIDALN